jgi:hypothetical protein
MKPIQIVFKRGKNMRRGNWGGRFDQSTLHVCTELAQWNAIEQLIHTNKSKVKKNVYKQ